MHGYSRICSACEEGKFSLGGVTRCQICSGCPEGQGAVINSCSSKTNTICEPCVEGHNYSSKYSQDECFPCTICDTQTLTNCAVDNDVTCSTTCRPGHCWDADLERCIDCCTSDRHKPECNNTPQSNHTSGSNTVVIVIGVVTSAAVCLIIAIVLVICVCKQCCRTQGPLQQSQQMDGLAVLGKDSLVKCLPKKTKYNLALVFMLRNENNVNPGVNYQQVWADILHLSREDLLHLHLLHENVQHEEFSTNFFNLIDQHRPDMTIGELSRILAACGRLDIINDMKEWAKEEKVDLQICEADFADNIENQSLCGSSIRMILCYSPMTESAHLLDNQDRRDSLNSTGRHSPRPDSPPLGTEELSSAGLS